LSVEQFLSSLVSLHLFVPWLHVSLHFLDLSNEEGDIF
jgi:hypothetical protein